MPALAEVHLVSDPDDLGHPFRPEMIALLDHLADPGESLEAAELHAPQGECREVRNHAARELPHRADLVFEGSIGAALTDPAAL